MKRLLAVAMIAASAIVTTGSAVAAPEKDDGAINFRVGGFFPTGQSDFWRDNAAAFTYDHTDFAGGLAGFGYTAPICNYFEIDVNADFYSATTRSSDRDIFVYPNNDLIFHDTRLSIVPVTVGFRVLPAGRFSQRGSGGKRLVRHPVPYFGAGVGGAFWQYEEQGDFAFVNPDPPPALPYVVDYDRRQASGLAFEKHVKIGIELPVAPKWNITLEARRSWANAKLSENFPSTALSASDPRRLDLGGYSVYVGASLRF